MQFLAALITGIACIFYLSVIETTMDTIIKFIALGRLS
jgi:hypothetical protein